MKYLKYIPVILFIIVLQGLIHRGIIIPDSEIRISFISIRWYAIFMIAAVLVLIWIVKKIASREKDLNKLDVEDAAFYAAVPALVLARSWHVATDWYLYSDNPVESLYIWNGGLSIFGAVIGVLIGLYFYSLRKEINLLKVLNVAAFGLPLAQAIGRYGNLINRELFGTPLDAFWAIFVPNSHSNNPSIYDSEYFHPAYLYEQIGNVLLFCLNLYIFNKFKLSGNLYIISWLIGYGLIRFVVEFYRLGNTLEIGLTFSQIVSLVMIVVGLAILIFNNFKRWEIK